MDNLGSVELTQPGRGGGLGRAIPRCRHIGCVVSHGAAAAVSCCVVLCCWHLCHLCHLCRPCHHDMEGGGAHRKVCRSMCRDMGKLLSLLCATWILCDVGPLRYQVWGGSGGYGCTFFS